jgi:hypothetical protein
MPGWQDVTSNTYWDAGGSGTSWTGTAWYSNAETVDIDPKSWATGYAPTKLKFASADSPTSWTLVVNATIGGQFTMGVTPGVEIALTHTGDIVSIQIVGNLGTGEITVTKLELYGEAISLGVGVSMPYTGPYRMFTRNYPDYDINYVWDWEYDHLDSGFSSGNDEVTMRCMRLYEMEAVSGDVRTGMLLFTDSTSVGRQTGTVIDSTEYLFDKDLGITTDVIESDENVLFIFEKNPTDLSGGTDESDFPPYLRKYVEYAVLERAYAVDNDGNIASLRDYWAMRKTVGLKAIQQFMRLRKTDRNYRLTTKGTPGFRTRREPRLPDSYPASLR